MTEPKFKASVEESLKIIPENYTEMSELELELLAKPTDVDRKLRYSFYFEVENSIKRGSKVRNENIYKDICSNSYFYNKILKSPEKMAFITRPMTDLDFNHAYLYRMGLDRLPQLIAMDFREVTRTGDLIDGTVDPRKANVWLKLMESLGNRVLGQPVERIQQHTVSEKKQVVTAEGDVKSLDAEIKRLQKQLSGTNVQVVEIEDAETEEIENEPKDNS